MGCLVTTCIYILWRQGARDIFHTPLVTYTLLYKVILRESVAYIVKEVDKTQTADKYYHNMYITVISYKSRGY